MNLYTVILDFKGGTYISQIEENNEELALHRWVRSVDHTLSELDSEDRKVFTFDMDHALTPLLDLQNIWCATFLINDSVALVNIINTKTI